MQPRVRQLIAGLESVGLSPILPAAAVMLITLFAMSLAVAAPLETEDGQILLARGDATGSVPNTDIKPLATDEANGTTEAEADIFTMPLPAPHYHDRYRFYHRYDFDLRSRINPTTPETN